MSETVSAPDWLNESFLRTVLQENVCCDKEVKVSGVEVTHAVPPGANYASDLFRVRGIYQEKEISVLVKVLATTNYIGKFIEEQGIMEKEYIAYKDFLPEVYKLLPESERFTAKLLYTCGPKCMVLEDLKEQGFVMADRLKQLDLEHCLVCMRTLAKFHAASVAVIKKKPEFIENLGKEPIYNRNNAKTKERQRKIMQNIDFNFSKAVRHWDGFEDFEEKSRGVWETLQDDLYDVFEPRKDCLNVMNHGDLWTNNMLFKYDNDGNIVDFRLVDLQMCRYGSPATDLLYFLFTSANYEVRENKVEELFTAYLETLNSLLKQLDCEERLTKKQLEAEVKRTRCYVFAITYSILGVVLSDPDDLFDIDEMTEESLVSQENNPFTKSYYGKYYRVIAPQVMRYLYNVRFFER